jgi:RNA polymerase sigma factor (sigma-70 family)
MAAVLSRGYAAAANLPAAPAALTTHDLYERYGQQIFRFCHRQLRNREEAEDATQTTFLNAFRGLERGSAVEFESAWLYKIALNVCMSRQRSSRRRGRLELVGDLDAMQDRLPARDEDHDELFGLDLALRRMPEQQRRALLLREWQGLTYREIGQTLGLSQPAVETLLFRARQSLAEGLTAPATERRRRGRPRASTADRSGVTPLRPAANPRRRKLASAGGTTSNE